MRRFPAAFYCVAAWALACGPAGAQDVNFLRVAYPERPPAPTEPSVVIKPAATPAATMPAAAPMPVVPPKPLARAPVVPHEVVKHVKLRRPGRGPTGPVTVPAADVLVMMVRGTLASVNHANFTENYSVLHEMTTPALQARVTAAQFGRAFADLRKQNLDLSPALVLNPQFTPTPSVTPQGALRLAGYFPSKPLQINFAIDYRPVDGFWLVDGLSVSTLRTDAPDAPVHRGTAASATSTPTAIRPAPFADFDFFDKRRTLASPSRFTHTTHFGPGRTFASSDRL
jgi:hypothetical protein